MSPTARCAPTQAGCRRGWCGSKWPRGYDAHRPTEAAVEEVFLNENPQSTLKLGQARGVVLLTAARRGIEVGEYAPRLVKKAVVGVGGAEKAQIHAMVQRLLPGVKIAGSDAADALAVAITHAHHLASRRAIGNAA